MVLARFRSWRIALAIAVPVLLTSLLVAASTTDRYRFNTRTSPCYYHYIYQQNAPVDLLVLGGSSMMAAVDPLLLSNALGSAGRRGMQIVNLASPWYGADAMAQLFDEFTQQRATTNALVMVRFEGVTPFHRKGYFSWPIADVLHGAVAPGVPIVERLSTVWHSVLKRLRDVVFVTHRALPNYRRNPERHLALYADTNTCLLEELKDAERTERLDQASARLLKDGLREAPYDWETGNAYTLHYLKRIDQLARERGINLIMIRMPDLWEDVWSLDSRQSLSRHLNTRLLDMPLHLRWELFDAKGYRDERHLVTPGREIFSPWLATELAPLLR